MIAIGDPVSTCIEPVNTAVNELSQNNEPEEYEDGSFARLLFDLLQKSDTGFVPENEDSNVFNLSGEGLAAESIKTPVDAPQKDLYDSKIPDEHFNTLLDAQSLYNRFVENANAETDDLLPRISNLIADKFLPELELDADFFAVDPKDTIVSQIAGTAIKDETGIRKENQLKDRNISKMENIGVPVGKDANNEKISKLQNGLENENSVRQGSRLDEMRNRSRRGLTFEVRDMRTETANGTQTRSYSILETATGRTQGNALVREITLELRLPDSGQSSQAQTVWETRSGNTGAANAMENMLARELHQNFNGDIVRHASMALRDGGAGTIKIALHPESLGNVKIHLEMTENKITGRIVVDSIEALNAFRKELSSLEQAFRESGFTSADLNLSLTSDGQSADEWEQETNSYTPRMAALRYEGEQDILRSVDVFLGQKPRAINLLA